MPVCTPRGVECSETSYLSTQAQTYPAQSNQERPPVGTTNTRKRTRCGQIPHAGSQRASHGERDARGAKEGGRPHRRTRGDGTTCGPVVPAWKNRAVCRKQVGGVGERGEGLGRCTAGAGAADAAAGGRGSVISWTRGTKKHPQGRARSLLKNFQSRNSEVFPGEARPGGRFFPF